MQKNALIIVGLMALTALAVVVGIPSLLSAAGPADPQTSKAQAAPDVSAMFKEIQKDLTDVRAELTDIRSILRGTPELAATTGERAALQLAKDFADALLIKPNLEKMTGLVDAPFLYPEDNKVIKNKAELLKRFKDDIDSSSAGRFTVGVDDVRFEIAKSLKLNAKTQKLFDAVVPKAGIIVKVTVKIPGDGVATEKVSIFLVVRMSKEPKIVGALDLEEAKEDDGDDDEKAEKEEKPVKEKYEKKEEPVEKKLEKKEG